MKSGRGIEKFLIAALLLLALAIYQIVLIFWDIPGQQISQGHDQEVQRDQKANLLEPESIYITLGGAAEGSYGRVQPKDEAFEELFLQGYAVLKQVLSEGKAGDFEWAELPWEAEACVFDYPFTLESFVIEGQLDLKEGALADGRWSEIWIVPAQTRREELQVFLLDRETNECLRVQAGGSNREENEQLLDLLLEQAAMLKKSYVAVAKAWPDQFFLEEYVLEETQRETAGRVRAQSAFRLDGEMDTEQMRSYAMQFFDYPDTVSVRTSDSTMLFTNEKMTVRLDASGRLQYVETLTDEEKQQVSVSEAYQLAAGFLQEDLKRIPGAGYEVVFAGCEKQEESYVFYFNYRIGGIPYRMETAKTVQWRMKYPVKITVEGMKVRRYERYMLDIQVEPDSGYVLESTWMDAMDVLRKRSWSLKAAPRLTYYLMGDRLTLQWESDTWQGRAWIEAS